jgi:DNA polymerase III subunit epsilon
VLALKGAGVTGPSPWWREPIFSFDVEATGIDAFNDRIVSWCGVLLKPTGHCEVNTELVNPGVPIPPGATEVHKITDEMVRTTGNPPAESLWRMVDLIADTIKARIPIVGMNLAYDFTMVNTECRRYGIPTIEEAAGIPLRPVVDAYVLDKQAVPRRAGKGARKLEALCGHWDVRHDGAHDAVEDAKAAARVIYRIVSRHPEIGDLPLQRLHDAQVLWRAAQSAELQAYFRSPKGGSKTDAVVDPCWPYCAGH